MIDSLFRSSPSQGATCRLMLLGFLFLSLFLFLLLVCFVRRHLLLLAFHRVTMPSLNPFSVSANKTKKKERKKKKHSPSHVALVTVSISL